MSTPTLVIIESPYGSPDPAVVAENAVYLRRCLRHSTLCLAESPYASHRMLTGALNDLDPEERSIGIAAGFAWRRVADLTAVYLDRGLSSGMIAGIQDALKHNRPIVLRAFGEVAPEVLDRVAVLGLPVERALEE